MAQPHRLVVVGECKITLPTSATGLSTPVARSMLAHRDHDVLFFSLPIYMACASSICLLHGILHVPCPLQLASLHGIWHVSMPHSTRQLKQELQVEGSLVSRRLGPCSGVATQTSPCLRRPRMWGSGPAIKVLAWMVRQ